MVVSVHDKSIVLTMDSMAWQVGKVTLCVNMICMHRVSKFPVGLVKPRFESVLQRC